MKVILASASETRHQGLLHAGIKHTLIPANIDESEIQDKDPQKRIIALAQAKAKYVADKERNALIIAADTFGIYRNKILEKPKFKMDALEVLTMLAGTSHILLTGWCVINSRTLKTYQGVSQTRVFFRKLDHDTILSYVNDHTVTSWAAGYSPMLSPAIQFITKVEGSLNGLIYGLPLEEIMPVLESENAV